MNTQQTAERKNHINAMNALLKIADDEARGFTDEEQNDFDGHESKIKTLDSVVDMETNKATVTKIGSASMMVNTGRGSEYSLSKALAAGAGRRLLDGVEAEHDQEMRAAQPSREVHGVLVPWGEIFLNQKQKAERSANIEKASGAISGGALNPLTGIDNQDSLFQLIDSAIGAQLLSSRLGGLTITSDEMSVLIPRQLTKVSAGHVLLDSDLPASGDPSFSNITMTPKLMGSISQLNLSSVMARHPMLGTADYYASELKRAIQAEMERVLIAGDTTTNNEEPNGLDILATAATGSLSAPGATTVSEISVINEQLINYLQTDQTGAKWVLPLEWINETKLAASFTGSAQSIHDALGMNNRMVNQDELVAGLNLTKALQVYTAYHGDFSTLVHCLWNGIDLSINEFSDTVFASGGSLVRAFMMHDIALIDPKKILSIDTTVAA